MEEETKRITTGYCEGNHKNTFGYSQMLVGPLLPKYEPAAKVYNTLWLAVLNINPVLEKMPVDDQDAKHFLHWLQVNHHSLIGFIWNKGNTNHRLLPDDAVRQIDAKIAFMKAAFYSATNLKTTEFITPATDYIVALQTLQNYIRQVEREYYEWFYSQPVMSDFITHLFKNNESAYIRVLRMKEMADFFNRMSSWLQWLMYYHVMLDAQAKGLNPTSVFEHYEWKSKDNELPPLFLS